MQCEKCNKEIVEGNFVYLPMQKQTLQGIIQSFMYCILCDICIATVPNKAMGNAKVVEAEIVN